MNKSECLALKLTEVSLSVKMRSYCVMFFIIFLSWSLVEVNSQTFPYISFMDQTLANHSYVDLRLVGRPDGGGHSLECHTDLTTCCSGSDGIHRGDWYFPNGTRLPFPISIGIYEARESQRVDLRRNADELFIYGIYHCDIATNAVHDDNDTVVRDTVYVGLYASDGGIIICK